MTSELIRLLKLIEELDPSTLEVVAEAQNGTVAINDDGTITYLMQTSSVKIRLPTLCV